jgi:hypothetical protein
MREVIISSYSRVNTCVAPIHEERTYAAALGFVKIDVGLPPEKRDMCVKRLPENDAHNVEEESIVDIEEVVVPRRAPKDRLWIWQKSYETRVVIGRRFISKEWQRIYRGRLVAPLKVHHNRLQKEQQKI